MQSRIKWLLASLMLLVTLPDINSAFAQDTTRTEPPDEFAHVMDTSFGLISCIDDTSFEFSYEGTEYSKAFKFKAELVTIRVKATPIELNAIRSLSYGPYKVRLALDYEGKMPKLFGAFLPPMIEEEVRSKAGNEILVTPRSMETFMTVDVTAGEGRTFAGFPEYKTKYLPSQRDSGQVVTITHLMYLSPGRYKALKAKYARLVDMLGAYAITNAQLVETHK